MKRLLMVSGVAAALFVIARAMADESRGQKSDEPRTIPLSEIVTTSPQKGMQYVQDVLQQRNPQEPGLAVEYLRKLLPSVNGSSNVFLVDAMTIDDALTASYGILNGARSADTPAPVNTPDPTRGNHWLVAYLGIGPSNPIWWTIGSVTIDKERVTLSYQKAKPMSSNRDLHRYFYWIPLGKLDSGAYALELVDADKRAVTLMRRVEVTEIAD